MGVLETFKENLKKTPIEKVLRVDGEDYDFISNGEIAEEIDDEFIVIHMYCEDDGEVIMWATVDIEIETGDVMNYETTKN